MAMTWDDYVDKCVAQLTDCRDKNEFQRALDAFSDQLEKWSTAKDRRDWFWAELEKKYEAAPKLILKEATAAAKLNALSSAAQQLLAAAAAKSKK